MIAPTQAPPKLTVDSASPIQRVYYCEALSSINPPISLTAARIREAHPQLFALSDKEQELAANLAMSDQIIEMTFGDGKVRVEVQTLRSWDTVHSDCIAAFQQVFPDLEDSMINDKPRDTSRAPACF